MDRGIGAHKTPGRFKIPRVPDLRFPDKIEILVSRGRVGWSVGTSGFVCPGRYGTGVVLVSNRWVLDILCRKKGGW